jgi:hypothetical protein
MTKSEAAFQDRVREHGCIVCYEFLALYSPCEIHHLLSGGRRIGEMHVLGLCKPHHRGGRNDAEVVSRHPWRKEFESRYGTEPTLLERTRSLVWTVA